MSKDDQSEQKRYSMTVEFTDGADPVTATGCTAEELGNFYDALGEDSATCRLWTDNPRRLVMFRGKFIRQITAVEEATK